MVTTNEDVAILIPVLEGADDDDGDALRVTGANAGSHDARVVDDATIRVTPKQDFHGTITVRYAVTDGVASVAGESIVTVVAANDPPTVRDKTQNAHGKVAVVLEGMDIDGDALTYEVVARPQHGELTGEPPRLEYRAVIGFVGDDAFTYVARDGSAVSGPATIRIHVTPGSPPTTGDISASGSEDRPLPLSLFASDPDGDPLTFKIERDPEHGTLSGTGPNFVFTPEQEFSGNDSFQFSVSDGFGSSSIATAHITILAVNDPPVASPQSVAATEDTSIAITLTGSDVEGGTLTFSAAQPQHGTLTGSGATRTYVPNGNFHGADHFTFTATDSSSATSAPAIVTIEVASVGDLPVAQAISRSVAEDSTVTMTLVGSDADGDAISYAVGNPQNGTLSGTPPALTYQPNRDYSGPDTFTYTVTAGGDTSATATVSLQVTPVNDHPVAVDLSVATDEDTDLAITLQATDVDSPAPTFHVLSSPSDGTLFADGANLVYRPAANKSGTRSFTYEARDNANGSDSATVTIVINSVNDAPTTADDFAFTVPGASVTFAVVDNDTDLESDAVSLDSSEAPEHGDIEIVDGKLRYTPDNGFTGVDVFAYIAVDSRGAASTGTAHVGVGTFPPGAPTEVLSAIGGAIAASDLLRVPAISADGRVVAFASGLPLVSDDTNGFADIYVFDRGTRSLERVSVATGGGQGNSASSRPHLSADGRHVVFDSLSSNLVVGDSNSMRDVFRRDRTTGETVRVSVATGGGQASGPSFDAEISDDGNLVVFESTAHDLIASDANGKSDVFVRNLAAGTTTRVSVTVSGSEADEASTEPTINGDGRFVSFTSLATNLVPGDSNNASDVFMHDRVTAMTTRVSVSSNGVEANTACSRPSLSHNGRFVSFRSAATNLVGGTPPAVPVFQIYVRDRQEQTTTMSAQPLPANGNIVSARLSADGRYVTAFSSVGVFIRDRFTGALSVPTGASTWMWPMLSANGRYVVALDSSNGGRLIVTPNRL